jgi:hypothetical protein
MNKDQIKGRAEQVKGKAKEVAGLALEQAEVGRRSKRLQIRLQNTEVCLN